jgi:hypothetical protein
MPNSAIIVNPSLYAKLPYDTVRDSMPVEIRRQWLVSLQG